MAEMGVMVDYYAVAEDCACLGKTLCETLLCAQITPRILRRSLRNLPFNFRIKKANAEERGLVEKKSCKAPGKLTGLAPQ